MHLALMLVLTAVSQPSQVAQGDGAPGITLSSSAEGRKASLLGGVALDATYTAPTGVSVLDGLTLSLGGLHPLDQGGGLERDTRSILALLLGLVIGFGLGHLIAQDREGFILFLIVDIVIVALSGVLVAIPGVWWFSGIGGLALLISHIIQGIDAYGKASGHRIVEWTRESSVEIARAPGREAPAVTHRALALAF